jgi:hypothetical protein
VTTADVDRICAVNIRGVHLGYKFAATQMVKQGAGGNLIAACLSAVYRVISYMWRAKQAHIALPALRNPEPYNLSSAAHGCDQEANSLTIALLVTSALVGSVNIPFDDLILLSDTHPPTTFQVLSHATWTVTTEMTNYMTDDPYSTKVQAILDDPSKRTPLMRILGTLTMSQTLLTSSSSHKSDYCPFGLEP